MAQEVLEQSKFLYIRIIPAYTTVLKYDQRAASITEANEVKLDLRAYVPNYIPRDIETHNRLYQDSPCLRKDQLHHVAASVLSLH